MDQNKVYKFAKLNLLEIFALTISVILCMYFINNEKTFMIDIEKVGISATILFTIAAIIRHIRGKIWHRLSDNCFRGFLFLYAVAVFIVIIGIGKFIITDNLPDRRLILSAYALVTLFFIGINYIMTKQIPKKVYASSIDSYKRLLKFSDWPILCTFIILLIASLLVYRNQLPDCAYQRYESFFSGAAAFQMFFSNIIWLIVEE